MKEESARSFGERTMGFALEAVRLFGTLSKAKFAAKIGDRRKELDETSDWFARLGCAMSASNSAPYSKRFPKK